MYQTDWMYPGAQKWCKVYGGEWIGTKCWVSMSFDNIWKQMSIMVDCPDRTIKLLCEGYWYFTSGHGCYYGWMSPVSEVGTELWLFWWRTNTVIIDNYAREGLWTLVVASTELTQREVSLLTGDKQETAIIIGFSHLLLEWDMHQIINNGNKE
jgi:hypothetical protein